MLLHLASSLMTVVRQAGWLADENLEFRSLNFISSHLCFLVLNAVFDVRWTNTVLFHKGDLCRVRCF